MGYDRIGERRRVPWRLCSLNCPVNNQLILRSKCYESNIQNSSFRVIKSFLLADCVVDPDPFCLYDCDELYGCALGVCQKSGIPGRGLV